MHARLALLFLLLLASCGDAPEGPGKAPDVSRLADFGSSPAAMELPQAAVLITPPVGRWRHTHDSLAPGQYYEQFLSEDRKTLLRAVVFPVRGARDPYAVLMPAVDIFFRGLGVHGFGVPTRRATRVWGAPAAEGTLNAIVLGEKVAGEARLMLLDPETWALAIGYASSDAAPASADVVRRFVLSLEPRDPQFYSPDFRAQAELDRVVAKPEGEPPVTMKQIAAIELVLEAGVGARFPLGTRRYVRDALVMDVQRSSPKMRSAYREAALALEKSADLDPAERARGMRALGQRILQAILDRTVEGYEPAVKFAAIWNRLRGLALGSREDGLTVGDLVCLNEMSAFLASLAANRAVKMDDKTGHALRSALTARWPTLTPEQHGALGAGGSTWAGLRQAWDLARPAARFAFRRAVAARLSPEPERAAIEALADSRALMQNLDQKRDEAFVRARLQSAFELSSAERTELLTLLNVEPKPHQLGW